jgi:hypothetical protein
MSSAQTDYSISCGAATEAWLKLHAPAQLLQEFALREISGSNMLQGASSFAAAVLLTGAVCKATLSAEGDCAHLVFGVCQCGTSLPQYSLEGCHLHQQD